MNIPRIMTMAAAIFLGFLQLMLTLHHVVKIRLGDAQEGWSLSFVFWLVINPLIMASLIELARKMKD